MERDALLNVRFALMVECLTACGAPLLGLQIRNLLLTPVLPMTRPVVVMTCGLSVCGQHGNNTTNNFVANCDDGVPFLGFVEAV
jgi:hypothetical protein